MQVASSYYHKMGETHNALKHTLMWAKPYIPLDKHKKTSEMCVVATRASLLTYVSDRGGYEKYVADSLI